jgi:hypothetical protein
MTISLKGFTSLRLQAGATLAILLSFFLLSCSKDNSGPGGKPPAVFDSSESAKPITVTESEHRIFFRPKVGDVFHYMISERSTSSAISTGPISGSEKASTEDLFYLKQTIRTIRPDSSVDMTFRFDSIIIKAEKDTMKINLSSNRAADKKDPRFASYAALLGEDIGVIVSRFSDIKEIYGTSSIISDIMQRYPDSMRTPENINTIKQQIENNIAEYIHETMMHYPNNPQAKDSTISANVEQNMPVWVNVIYPMQISIRQVLTGFEERGGKMLAIYMTTTNYHPRQAIIENGPVKSSLNNYSAVTKEEIRVEDATGVLIHRTESDDQSFTLVLESKEQPNQTLTTERKSKSLRTIELLR